MLVKIESFAKMLLVSLLFLAVSVRLTLADSNPLSTDINGDGIVNILDLGIAANAYGSQPWDPKWNAKGDINGDGVIDILDMALMARDFGKRWVCFDFDKPLNWTVVGGTWDVMNGLLDGFSNTEGLIYAGDMTWKDCTLTAKVKIAADSPNVEAAFCIGLVDSGNFYWAGLGCWGHKVSISKVVDGVPQELIFSGSRAEVIKDVWYIVSIKISGSAIALYINDVLEFAIDDSTFASGAVGVRLWGSHIYTDYITVSGVASTNQSSVPDRTGRKLYVDGTLIKDGFGNAIRLHGFNCHVGDIDEEGIQWMKNKGFNSMRINFYWLCVEPNEGVYDFEYLRNLDDILYWCEKYHIYAILDFHQWLWSTYFTYYDMGVGFPDWLVRKGGYANSPDGLKQCVTDFFAKTGYGVTMRQKYIDFWKFIVNRYKQNPYVWAYEPINEPLVAHEVSYSTSVADGVMDMYENDFTPTIRQIDADTIIIYHNFGGGEQNIQRARRVSHKNIVWTCSWYDFAYDGYYPSEEYTGLRETLQQIKNTYNDRCGTPFVVSEMGFTEGTYNAEQWIRDSYDVMRSIGLNKGFECWNWWIYHKGEVPELGSWQTPRNSDGSDTWIIPVLQEYLGNLT
jgi:aryl-phospho-beta-D-glucosidase BglC (GH1 family)